MGNWHSSLANSPWLDLGKMDQALGRWLGDVMSQDLLGDTLWEVQTWVYPCRMVVSVDRIIWVAGAKAWAYKCRLCRYLLIKFDCKKVTIVPSSQSISIVNLEAQGFSQFPSVSLFLQVCKPNEVGVALSSDHG